MAASTTLMEQDSVVCWLPCRRATDRLEHRSLTAVVGDTGSDAAAVWHHYFNGAGEMPGVQKGSYGDLDPILALSPLRRKIRRFIRGRSEQIGSNGIRNPRLRREGNCNGDDPTSRGRTTGRF